jgi:hypothetical protein
VQFGDSGAVPMWVSYDTGVKLRPSFVRRYLLETVAAKLRLLD